MEHSKNVNIFALKPEIFIIPDETVNDKESCEDTDLNSLKRIDSIPEIENNDKSSEKSINSTNVEKFFMVHPFITTHPKNHFRRNAKKLEPGRIIVDKLPKLGKWKEFPIVDGKPQRLSDEAFRKLGDKVWLRLYKVACEVNETCQIWDFTRLWLPMKFSMFKLLFKRIFISSAISFQAPLTWSMQKLQEMH